MNWVRINKKYKPPKLALRFLNWFCSFYLIEEIEGDLIEKFETRKSEVSRFQNIFFFYCGVLGFVRPAFWRKNLLTIDLWGIVMFRSNLKFAVRNILKNGFFSTINISGLALGIACVLFIFFYVQDELSYDKFHANTNRIFRVTVNANFRGNDFNSAQVGGVVAPTMLKDFPEVESYVRFKNWGMNFVRYEDKTFKEYDVFAVDSTFFDFFSVPVILGNPETIFSQPGSVVISRRSAEKYFGNENPIGKELSFDERNKFNVTGIFENIPTNSHLKADFLIYKKFHDYDGTEGWTNNNYYTYILLKKNSNINSLKAKLPLLMENYGWAEIEKFGINIDELRKAGTFWDFKLQNISEIHFDTFHSHNFSASIDMQYIYIFSGIAIFILLIASINFINLSTAKSASRAKEVGIKKVVGSYRKDLILQFLTESVVISFIAFLVAIGLVELLKNYFYEVIGKEFSISYFDNLGFGLALISIIIITGILGGSFPAFILSKFNPTDILRGSLKNVMKKQWFRGGLVVFQFTASLILIIGTLVIIDQLNYMQTRNLGFDKEQVLIVDDPYILKDKAKVFKNKMSEHQNVVSSTMSGYLPINSYRGTNGIFRDGDKNDTKVSPQQMWRIDENYFETLGMEIIKGRNFSLDMPSDSQACVINKAALKYFEFENPFDHTVGQIKNNKMTEYNIIGVVENFHFSSLKNKVDPVIFLLARHTGLVSFKVNGNITQVVDYAKSIWEDIAPGQPFGYRFMDETFNEAYKAEENMLNLFSYFAVMAIIIGCLGLFALSAYTVERRTKEIGIRKVMGAKTLGLVFQLTKEFSLLVVTALLLASPIAYYLMDKWLSDYAYRIDLGIFTFVAAGILALSVALITISYHAVKTSMMNPVKSIRYE